MSIISLKKRILPFIFLLFLGFQINAQGLVTGYSYTIGLPQSDLKDYTNANSYKGLHFDFRYFLTNNFTIGLGLGWQVFKEKETGVFSQEGRDITGTQVRFVNLFPLMINSHYHFGEQGGIRPYIGIGAGQTGRLQRTDVGVFRIQENKWHFSIAPEIGVMIPIREEIKLNLGVQYHYTFQDSETPSYNFIGINMGILLANGY